MLNPFTFINAVINFFIVAIVLFTIVKIFNKIREERNEFIEEGKLAKADRKEMKKLGIKLHDISAVKAFLEDKKQKDAEAKAKAEAEAAEKARLERLANPTTEDLLKEILEIMKNK